MVSTRVRNVAFVVMLIAGFVASREASARGDAAACWACTGIFGETCEPCEGGEDCGTSCQEAGGGLEDCTIYGNVCWKNQ